MDNQIIAEQLLVFITEQGVEVRKESMGGGGGGLCDIRNKRVFFHDTDSSSFETAVRCSQAIVKLYDDLESIYLKPAIREFIDKYGTKD